MLRWLRSLLAWRLAYEAGAYAYYENAITGARRVKRIVTGGYSPINERWLKGGPWLSNLSPPPFELRI